MPADAAGLQPWGQDRLADVAALWRLCSAEPLSVAELARTVGERDGLLLATPDGGGVVAAVVRHGAAGTQGYVRLLAVHPRRRRLGAGRLLLRAAEEWLAGQGATSCSLGGEAPRYLWPGVDASDLATQALAGAAGYRATGIAVNLSMPTSYRSQPPPGVRVRLVGPGTPPEYRRSVRRLVEEQWPAWGTEVGLGLSAGTVAGAFDTGRDGSGSAVGFCAHSTLRDGWIGPMGTHPGSRGRGVAAATLACVCADLAARGHDRAEVAWVGPVGWFADRGARTSRVFLRFRRDLDAAQVTRRA